MGKAQKNDIPPRNVIFPHKDHRINLFLPFY